MDLVKFKQNLERELEIKILNKGKTPLLDRLQIHLNNLKQKYNLATMLNPKNLEEELYLSMLYQIIYPARKNNVFNISYEGEKIHGNTDRAKIQNLIIKIGVDDIKKLPTYSRFLYKKDIAEVVGNAYKVVGENHSFDTSFGGVGASSSGRYFVKELKDILKLNVEFTYEEEFSYN
jgi:hypothetical protein